MSKIKIVSFLMAISTLGNAHAQKLSVQPESEKSLVKITKIIAVPENQKYTGNAWSQLKAIFPKTNWVTTTDKNYSDARKGTVQDINKKIDVVAAGAASIINYVAATIDDEAGSPNLFRDQIKGLGTQAKLQCSDEDNSESNGSMWYEITLKELKPVYATVSWSSGSGGGSENLELDNSPVKNSCEKEKSAKTNLKFGYLTGKIKQFNGAGCTYKLLADDNKKSINKIVGADSFDGSGIVLNVDGQDILVKGGNDAKGSFSGVFGAYKVNIPSGKVKSCGEECSKTITSVVITKNPDYKNAVQVVGYCGS